MAQNNSPELTHKIESSLTSIEYKLKKIQSSIEQSKTLKQELQELFEKTEKLEALVRENPEAKTKLTLQFSQNKQLIPLFTDVKQNLSSLLTEMQFFEQREQKADHFLSAFDSRKTVDLGNAQHVGQFLQAVSYKAKILDLTARPGILGIIKMDQIARHLSIPQKSQNEILVPIEKLQKFLEFVYSHKPFTPILLSSAQFSALIRANYVLDVQSTPEFLKEIQTIGLQ